MCTHAINASVSLDVTRGIARLQKLKLRQLKKKLLLKSKLYAASDIEPSAFGGGLFLCVQP